jgi:glycosyltransferase involved in cell wall biosynthesis
MRVLVEASAAVLPEPTGVGGYLRSLLGRLPIVDPSTGYVVRYVRVGRATDRDWLASLPLSERPIVLPRGARRLHARTNIPPLGVIARCDVVFVPNFRPPVVPWRRSVVTVHDLAFRLFPETAPHAAPWWQRSVRRSIHRASRILVPSESTRRDLLRLEDIDPIRVVTVPLAVDRTVYAPASAERVEAVRAKHGIDGPYVLFLGRHPRKNLHGMLRAFAAVPDDVRPRLVVTGSPPVTRDGSDRDRDALSALPDHVRSQVSLIGHVPTGDVPPLLTGSEGLVFPTFYEGFGLPALEAMSCGAPVLASNVSALPEVVGDAALLVDPLDDHAIVEGMIRLVTDEPFRVRLRSAGFERVARFDWDQTAKATAAVLHDAARSEESGIPIGGRRVRPTTPR